MAMRPEDAFAQALGASMQYTKQSLEGAGALKGDKGDKGDPGPQGPAGPKGDTGAAGKDGSQVSVTQVLSTGTKIAEIEVDGDTTELYAPQGGGTGGGHTIEDAEGTDLTQRDTLQFGEGFKAEDDSTNQKTVITPDVMQSGDMSDVITPLPTVQPRYQKYSTEEQIVGEWIDGKPIYQKVIELTPSQNSTLIDIASFNVEQIVSLRGLIKQNQGNQVDIPFWYDNTYYSYVMCASSNQDGVVDQILFFVSSSVYFNPAKIIFQYTKTTD